MHKRSSVTQVAAVILWAGVTSFSVWAQSARPGLGSMPYADAGGTGVTFRTWAPNATSVGVKGQFNGWATAPLIKEGSSPYWSRDVAGAVAGQEYKLVINGNSDRRDPRGRRVVNSAGNSITYDPNAFDWGGVQANPPWKNDLVIYEMHVGTYNAESWIPSTFDGCIARLDHLVDMGVNAVQVMPIMEFAGDRSWGYNPADVFAVESGLGGPDAFKRFVKACHEKGLAVLVDVVHNHYGPSDLALWQFDGWSQNGKGGIYFYNDSRASTMWADTRPDYGRAEVRQFIHDNIQMYLSEFRVDGFRWDSVFSMLYANSGSTFLTDAADMLRDINWMIATQYPGRIRIAEDHAFDANMNFDGQWDVGFHDHVQWQVTRGSDAERNMNWLGDRIGGSHNRVLFSESHDTAGDLNNKYRLPRYIDGSNPWSIWARKRQLLAQGMVMTAPGIPMIFQGQEMNEDWSFSSSTSLRWELTNTWKGIVRAYTDMVHARRNLRGGTQGLKGTGVNVQHKDDLNKVISYIRWDAGGGADDVVVVANFAVTTWTNNNYLIEFPSAGTWYSHFNGDSTNFSADFGNIGSAQVVASGSPPKAAVNMGMYSLQIFSKTAPPQAGQLTLQPAEPVGCVPVSFSYVPGDGPLAGATQVVASVGVNGWQALSDVGLTNNGSGVWSGDYPLPFGAEALDVSFHNGAETNRVWDNNLNRDWHFPITGCADLPALVTLSPAFPQGCVPVQVTYAERAGPLMNASNVVLFIGRNGWQNIAEIPLGEAAAGVWTGRYEIAGDTWQLDYVFRGQVTNQLTWDNNGGADWRAYVTQCVDTRQPSISVTNPSSDVAVSNEVFTYDLLGTIGSGIVGDLQWSNSLTGASGTLPAGSNWMVGAIALQEGVNLLRVHGTNSALNPNADTRDSATNTTYTGPGEWTNGQDGGTGWGGGWQLNGGISAGHFLAGNNVSNLQLGSQAWGLWANNGGLSDAVRPLVATLHVGDVMHLRFENNWIEGGASAGLGWQNRFGQNLVEFLFIGGATNYILNDAVINRATGIPWTDQGLTLEFEMLSADTYRLTANSVTLTGQVAATSESVVDRIRTWNYETAGGGHGEGYNVYLSEVSIQGAALESSVFQDEVAITRQPGRFSDADGDGFVTWEEEFAGTDPNSAASHLPDIGWLPPGGPASYVEIPTTVPARWYDIFYRTNLMDGTWSRLGVQRQASGGNLWLDFTNQLPSAFYRTGVYEP